jgi:hypothetical protein
MTRQREEQREIYRERRGKERARGREERTKIENEKTPFDDPVSLKAARLRMIPKTSEDKSERTLPVLSVSTLHISKIEFRATTISCCFVPEKFPRQIWLMEDGFWRVRLYRNIVCRLKSLIWSSLCGIWLGSEEGLSLF